MNNKSPYSVWLNWKIIWVLLTAAILSSYSLSKIFARSSEEIRSEDKFVITGSEFYRRSQFDAGEIRIFLKNTGKEPMSISQCKLGRFLAGKDEEQNEAWREIDIDYLYSKSTPPVLMPCQSGELLIKLLKSPPNNSELKCTINDKTGSVSETSILIKQAPFWVSYLGFSEDLSKVYVYGQNNTQKPLSIRLLEVAGVNVTDNYQSINNNLPPGDKNCLVFEIPIPFTFGEYVHVAVSVKSGDQKWQTHRIVRAVNKFPLLFGKGSGDRKLGLDSERFFITSTSSVIGIPCIQNMSCPAHNHGTHENAARKFLDNRYSIFSQNPYLLIQMWICRADKPRAWYTFGSLPDAAVMNPVLSAPWEYKRDTKVSQWFHPFFWLATMAKKATAPNRYFACIPVKPEDAVFLQSNHTPEEIKFLTYCAIASGAKGILYRGKPSPDQLSQDNFVQLNKELLQLGPLLMIAEPVNWASTADNNYAAKSLLCGDEAILIIVLDCRYLSEQQNNRLRTPAFGKAIKRIKIKVKVPEGSSVSEVKSMYTPLSKNLWNYYEGQLDFTANMVDSVQVYKVVLERASSVKSLAGSRRFRGKRI